MQTIVFVGESISQGMADYAKNIPRESIVEIKGTVKQPEKPIEGCSQKIELHVAEIFTVNKAVPILPFSLEEASRRVENQEEEDKEKKADEESKEKHIHVG